MQVSELLSLFIEYSFLLTMKKLFVIFSSETTLILIHPSHGKRFDTEMPVFKVSHSARGGV